MSIAASDIKFYGSAVMPDDDSTTEIGGAIDTTVKVEFTDIDSAGAIEAVSDSASDTTQTVTVTGRASSGEIISSTKTLTGTSAVDFDGTFERILKVVKSGSTTGTVTIRKDGGAGDLVVMEPTITEVRRPFYSAVADVSGGSARTYYEKIFCKNTHGSLSLLAATIKENSDPESQISFALETSVDGSGTNGAGNNRQTAPSTGVGSFNSSDKTVPGNDLAAGEAIGIWLKLDLPAGDPATKTTYQLRASGNTT